jgi:hypothetical protein
MQRRLRSGCGLGLGGGGSRGGGSLLLLLLGLALASSSLLLGSVRGSPEGEVVTEELHDEGAVAVRLLAEAVELGDGVVEGLLGEVAGAVGRVQDLVVEDGEVEGKSEADGVRRGELGLGNVGGVLQVLLEACF